MAVVMVYWTVLKEYLKADLKGWLEVELKVYLSVDQ
jgi:hypothetical protein